MSKFESLYVQVKQLISGGVNFLVCVFIGVGGVLLFIECVDGVYLFDVDGKVYIDYVGFWGLMVLGYNYLVICQVVIEVVECGLSFGVLIEMEVKMVELVINLVLIMDMV